MACCVRGYHEYKDIEAAATREVLVCGHWRAIVGKIFVVNIRVKYFRTFSVCENIFATKRKRIEVNYGIQSFVNNTGIFQLCRYQLHLLSVTRCIC